MTGSMLNCIKTGMLVPNPARHSGSKEERKTLLHTRTARITISQLDAVVVLPISSG